MSGSLQATGVVTELKPLSVRAGYTCGLKTPKPKLFTMSEQLFADLLVTFRKFFLFFPKVEQCPLPYSNFRFFLDLKWLVSTRNSENTPVDFTWQVNFSGLVEPSSAPRQVLMWLGSHSKGPEMSLKYLRWDLRVMEISLAQTCSVVACCLQGVGLQTCWGTNELQISTLQNPAALIARGFSVCKENHEIIM